ncbi:hypothetical protein MCUN1_000833 [Malassezia cuniculi]|uniref:Uncharacterized protein n=1 Tax=Malassezia cuniculi TaxID=948313 RepID=A0AAF0J5F4_9BASI|nr:hypothetical protein MCUN1_000833 [Malassezia cuniculi]
MDSDDASFDDAWWDSLAIDPNVETQLQAVEQLSNTQSQTVATTLPPTKSEPCAAEDEDNLHKELAELRALKTKQEEVIAELKQCNQAQRGEIAVVRGNWNRAKLENNELRQTQSELEVDYRKRLEQIQQENQRQFEKLETASAFRRIEQDTRSAAWPSTIRARNAWDSRKRRADTQLTPTKSQRRTTPPSSQESPLLMSRTKRMAAHSMGHSGVFLRMGLTHLLANVLGWMAALGTSHPPFCVYLLLREPESHDELATPVNTLPIIVEAIHRCYDTSTSVDIGQSRIPLLERIIRLLQVIVWSREPGSLHDLRSFFQTPGVLLALLEARWKAPHILAHTMRLLTLIARDPLLLHVCLSSTYDTALQSPVPQLLQSQFPVVDTMAKHLVDRRGDTQDGSLDELHVLIILFLGRAARHRDTCILLAESVPLLAALVQCLAWDTDAVWNTSSSSAMSGAIERVSLGVRLLHQLFAPTDGPTRNLFEKLLSPAAQAALNGIFYTFVVAI